MEALKSFSNPAPYHLLTYGILLGTEVFQSFIGGIIAFQALSRPQFSVLQQQIFPIYFGMQALLPLVLAVTYPSPASFIPQSFPGVLHPANRTSTLIPLSIMTVTGLLNWTILGPETTKTIRKRKHQETRDGKRYYDAGPHSEDMKRLNRKFSTLHGMSSLVNVTEIIMTFWYGIVLSKRL